MLTFRNLYGPTFVLSTILTMAQCKCCQPLQLDYGVSQFLIVDWWHCMAIKGRRQKRVQQVETKPIRGMQYEAARSPPPPSPCPCLPPFPVTPAVAQHEPAQSPPLARLSIPSYGSKLRGQHSRRRRRKPHCRPHFLIVIVPILNSSCRLVTDAAPGLVSRPVFSPYFMLEGLAVQCQCASLSVRSCRWIASHSASAVST